MKSNLHENFSLTNDEIHRNQAILKGKRLSLAKELEGKAVEGFLRGSNENLTYTPNIFPKQRNQTKCMDFLKKIFEKKFGRILNKNNKLNNQCLVKYLQKFSKLTQFLSFLVDIFSFMIFFMYLTMKKEFLNSFPLIFEIMMVILMILGVIMRFIPKKTSSFLYLLTFLIPLTEFFLRNNYSYINPYLNLFRGLRIIKINEKASQFVKSLLHRTSFREFYEKGLDMLFCYALFLIFGVILLMTAKFVEDEESKISELFLESEIIAFQCLNTFFCDETFLHSPRQTQIFILTFLVLYYFCIFKIVFETLQLFSSKRNISNSIFFKKADSTLFSYLRKRYNICFLGLPPIKMIEKLCSDLECTNKTSFFIYDLVFFLEGDKINESGLILRRFLAKTKLSVLSIELIMNGFLETENFAKKLRILKKANFIFAYFSDFETYITKCFYLKLMKIQKMLRPSQKIVLFTFSPILLKKTQIPIIMIDKIRCFCIANTINNPIFLPFLASLIKTDKNRNFLEIANLSNFFVKKTFEEVSKILIFSSFYCKEVKSDDESSIHTMTVVLGVLTANRVFFLNPSKYIINPADRILILTNDDDAVNFIENFNELNFKKFQQINDLVESSFKNLDEAECTESDFVKNLNFVKPQKKITGFPIFLDLFLNVHTNIDYEFENHYIIFAYQPLIEISRHLFGVIEKLKEIYPKANIIIFSNEKNIKFFEELRDFGCLNIFGSFFNVRHLQFLKISECRKLLILSSKIEPNDKNKNIFGNFLYRYLRESFPNIGEKLFFETDDFFFTQTEKNKKNFTEEILLSILSKYALNENLKFLIDGFMRESDLIICTLNVNDKLATKFKNFGNLLLFFFNLSHSIIPLGLSHQDGKQKKNEQESTEEFIANPELTLRLKKGLKILLFMKKRNFLEIFVN